MKDLGTVTLETKRLLLRPFTPDDAPVMYHNWASDSEVTKYLTWQPHESQEASRTLLEDWAARYADPTWYNWAIVWRETGEPIGNISVVERKEKTESYHIGYCLGQAFWHRGIMTEAFTEVIRFLFEEVGVLRVDARHDTRNPHSGGVMRKCGLTYEGTLRQRDRCNQGIGDSAWYGILREDYVNQRAKKEQEDQ